MKKILLQLFGNYIYQIVPTADIDAVAGNFGWHYSWLNNKNAEGALDKTKSNSPYPIMLIKAYGEKYEDVTDYVKNLGFDIASAEYLLGLGQDILKKYQYVVTVENIVKGESGLPGYICADYHDETELRILSATKKIGDCWWIPVYALDVVLPAASMQTITEVDMHSHMCAGRTIPFDFFQSLYKNGVEVFVDDDILAKFYSSCGTYVPGSRFMSMKTGDNKSNDFAILRNIKLERMVKTFAEIFSAAISLIEEDLATDGLMNSIYELSGQENLNLGYVQDELGVRMIYLERKTARKEYHLHSSYTPRLYKPNRHILCNY